MLQEKGTELFSLRYNCTDFSELSSHNIIAGATAYLLALAEHFRDALGIVNQQGAPSLAQRGVEENLPQQGYPMISSFLSKTARSCHLAKPAPMQTTERVQRSPQRLQPGSLHSGPAPHSKYQESRFPSVVSALKCPNLTHFAPSPPLLSPRAGCRETGAPPWLLPIPVQQYGRAGCHGLWLYSTMDQHKTNPFDTLLVK